MRVGNWVCLPITTSTLYSSHSRNNSACVNCSPENKAWGRWWGATAWKILNHPRWQQPSCEMIDATIVCLPHFDSLVPPLLHKQPSNTPPSFKSILALTSPTPSPPFQHYHCPNLVLPSFFHFANLLFFFSKVFSNGRSSLKISFAIFFPIIYLLWVQNFMLSLLFVEEKREGVKERDKMGLT